MRHLPLSRKASARLAAAVAAIREAKGDPNKIRWPKRTAPLALLTFGFWSGLIPMVILWAAWAWFQ